MLNSKVSKAVRLAFAFGAASTVAFSANTIAAENDQVERIEVTGSSIKGTDLAGALPVDVISADDIKKTGVTSVPDLISQIPSMQGFTTPTSSVGGGGGGIATASLRGLGDQYTLVLLNGRRLASAFDSGAVDLNSIPLASIQRVEVLTDGASALYGSDAIAGVINFILKKEVDQTTLSFRTDQPSDGGETFNYSVTTGYGDIDSDGFSLVASLSLDVQESLRSKDREFAKTGLLEFEHDGQQFYNIAGSPNAIPANAILTLGEGETARGLGFNPYYKAGGSCAVDNAKSPTSDQCMFDYTSTLEIVPESERLSFMVHGQYEVNDDIGAFATLSMTDFTMTTRIAPNPTGGISLEVGGDLYNKYVLPHLTDAEAAEVTDFRATWRALPGGNRTEEWNTGSLNSTFGFEGVVFDNIDFNTAVVYSTTEREQSFLDGHFYRDSFREAISSGVVDVFTTPDEFSDESLQALNATKWIGLQATTETESLSWDLRASQPVFELPAGDVYVGYGLDYRVNTYKVTESDENKKNNRWGDGGGTRDYDLERSTMGAFVEFQVPLLDDLSLSTAVRYDEIGGVKDNSIGQKANDDESDVTYKVSLRYTLNDDFVIRGSVGTGFRAATLRQIAEPRVRFGVTGAAYPCPIQRPDPRAAGCHLTELQYNLFNEGNAGLVPETSEQTSFGFVYSPSNEFTFEMDYWSVNIENQVSRPSQPYMFANATTIYNDQFILAPDPNDASRQLIHGVRTPVNIGVSRNSGIDWKLSLVNELSFGTLKSSVQGAYMMKSDFTEPGTADVWTSSLGRYGTDEEVIFRNVINAQTTLTHGDFAHTLRLNYRSSYRDAVTSVQAGTIANPATVQEYNADGDLVDVLDTRSVQLKVPSHSTVSYKFDYYGIEDVVISAGVKNLFDKAPPLTLGDAEGHLVGYEGRYYDQFLRTYYLSVDYSF
ncbi:hypothetical protein BGP78_02465 [Pseudoalteromonas sp. MSK9-3]|uniref:TonB-dependent receptor plug domain-containing protein n=1 Tax=Pseudoalteromonas sp. MSK9-3 TaxID=1897633 RepID=UPI000E6CE2C8|nr:TonB-dependent receptor [Pseudoalteromonas sp. MSK9-3]RJE75604.1 hypothetical protein BGP78_02465 [Pseudoalteromonas sp. MSK9-3]